MLTTPSNSPECTHELLPYFTKSSGTIDSGISYKHFYIANLASKLRDPDFDNFCVSSLDEDFAPFNDVVIEIKNNTKPQLDVFAIKFVLSTGRKALKIKDFTADHGPFNIRQYMEDIKHFPENTTAVLYTDASFSASNGQKIKLNCDYAITIWDVYHNWYVSNCYGDIKQYRIELRKSDDLIGTIYLYPNQMDLKKLKEDTIKRFVLEADDDAETEAALMKHVHFIHNWSKIEGKKEKLCKIVLKRMSILSFVGTSIRPLSFSSKPVTENSKLLREAISKLDIVVFSGNNSGDVTKLYQNAKNEITNLKQLNRVSVRYQIMPQTINSIEDFNGKDKETSILLWLMGKCPLVVDGNRAILYPISSRLRDNYLVLDPDTVSFHFPKCLYLHHLIKTEPESWYKVLKEFKCSIQGKEAVSLDDWIRECEDLTKVISTNELVQMVDGPILIGDKLPQVHDLIKFSMNIVTSQVLNAFTNDTMIVITGLKNVRYLKKLCDDSIKVKKLEDTEKDDGHEEPMTKTIFVSKNDCSKGQFDDLSARFPVTTSCYHFRHVDDEHLEWIRSNTIKDLEKYLLKDYFIEDQKLFRETNNDTEIICCTSDIEKNRVINLLRSSFPTMWTLFVNFKEHDLFSGKDIVDVQEVTSYLAELGDKEYTDFEKSFIQTLLSSKRSMVIWDGIDNISEKCFQRLKTVVQRVADEGVKQWFITLESDMKKMLQKEFNVLARNVEV